MTSHEISRRIDRFFLDLPYNGIVKTLSKGLSEAYSEYLSRADRLLALSSEKAGGEYPALKEFLKTSADLARQVSVRGFFKETELLDESITLLNGELVPQSKNPYEALRKDLAQFANGYEGYLRLSSVIGAVELLRRAHDFHQRFETLIPYLLSLQTSLQDSAQDLSDESETVSILLQPSDELRVSVAKLHALEVIYEELCRMLDVSTSQHPLRVIKIESGSLWGKLFGESRVITLLTELLKSGVDYLHRNYTREGKLNSMPKRVEELEVLLDLETKMKALGYETEGMKESNRKSGAIIAKELNVLLLGEPKVEINEMTYSVGSHVDRMIADRSRTLLLEDGSEQE